MNKFEHYQKQISRATEGALANEEIKKINTVEHLATIFRREESKYNRMVAAISIFKKIVPFDIKFSYNTQNFPINPEGYEFKEEIIGQGAENDVYLLASKNPETASWVLKVNHQDNGDSSFLMARAKDIKKEYEEVKDWFSEIPGFVLDEYSLIMESPRNGKPAIVTLQKYFGKEIKDLFVVMKDGLLQKMIEDNTQLKKDIFDFIRISEKKEKETGNSVDLIGQKNLSLIEVDGVDKLILLDPHFVCNPKRSEKSVQKRQKLRFDQLRKEIGYEDFQTDDIDLNKAA